MDFNGYELKYSEGATIKSLSKEAGCSYRKMRSYLHKKEVVRTKSEANYSSKHPEEFRKYSANYNYFDNIDSEDKAYWLGFITADGHVSDRELRIQLAIKDRPHIEKFLHAIESTHPIYDYEDSSLVVIKSRELSGSLQKYGLSNKKTYTVKPHLLPKQLSKHYWRGIFDGDGHITDKSCVLVGTKDICNGFRDFLIKNGIKTGVTVLPIKNTSCYKFSTSGKNMTKTIHAELYNNSSVSLDRKREVVCRGF